MNNIYNIYRNFFIFYYKFMFRKKKYCIKFINIYYKVSKDRFLGVISCYVYLEIVINKIILFILR